MNDKLNQDFKTLCDCFFSIWEEKTKIILFSLKNLSKLAEPLIVKHNDVILKQYPSVEYLECLLDNTLSGEDMAVKVC